jgi:Cu-Zn family superoxide dismutase
MMTTARRVPWLIACLGAVIVLSGCGGAGSGSNGSRAAAEATSGETSETPPTSVFGGNNATGTANTPGSSAESAAATTGGGTSSSGGAGSTASRASLVATANLLNPTGVEIGTVDFALEGSVITVTAQVAGLPPGFKGFHIHAIGKCEPNSPNPADPSKVGDFLSAGGHLGGSSASHPGHQGDLSSLQVRGDGSAELVTTTDAFDLKALLDDDGSAVMVHVGPDNFGNIPTRYAPGGPDADTQATGDSGGRAACGVVHAAG